MKALERGTDRSRGVLVLGMHRSGTSATAAALQERGFALGDDLVPAAPDNPEGYFEHAAAVNINDALLSAIGRTWRDVRSMPEGWQQSDAAHAAASAIRHELGGFFRAASPWALKDPRLCRLLPLWRDVLVGEGLDVACLLVLRHPAEVAASLERRDGMPREIAYILWLRHVLEAVTEANGLPMASLGYASMLSDGGDGLDKALRKIGFEVSPAGSAGLTSLRPALRNNVADTKLAANAHGWQALAVSTYDALLVANDLAQAAQEASARFDAMYASQGLSLAVVGDALGQSEHRYHAVREQWLGQMARGDEIQARLDLTDQTLSSEQMRSLERLEVAEKLQAELATTQAAFDDEVRRSLERLSNAEALQVELANTQAAFDEEARRSLERLSAAEALQVELARTQSAFEEEVRRSLERLSAAEGLQAELSRTQSALKDETRRSLERMSAAELLQAELSTTQTALTYESQRSLERLHAAEALQLELTRTQIALDHEAKRSLERMQNAAVLQAALDATQEAFEAEAARSIARLVEVETLDARLVAAHAQIGGLELELAQLQRELSDTEARLTAITSTRWWRVRAAVTRSLSKLRAADDTRGVKE